MKTGKIIGVYSSNRDGEEYITKNGNPFLKVCVSVDDKNYYDAFFFTPKSHWKFESLFKACGAPVPSYDDIKFSTVENLIGCHCLVRVGKDKGGYDTVNLYRPIESKEAQDAPTPPPEPEPEPEQPADDPDLFEDVPF